MTYSFSPRESNSSATPTMNLLPQKGHTQSEVIHEHLSKQVTNVMYYQFLTTKVQRNVRDLVREFQCHAWDYLPLAQSSLDNKSNGILSPGEAPANMIPRFSERLLPEL